MHCGWPFGVEEGCAGSSVLAMLDQIGVVGELRIESAPGWRGEVLCRCSRGFAGLVGHGLLWIGRVRSRFSSISSGESVRVRVC